MKMRVRVTQQHIDQGRGSDLRKCAIALALSGKAGVSYASVGADSLSVIYRDEWWHANLPDRAQEFIIQFDDGESVEPTSFTLELRR